MSPSRNNDSSIESIEHELYDPKQKVNETEIHSAKKHRELDLPTSWGEESSIISKAGDDRGISFGAKLLLVSMIVLIGALAFSAWRVLSSKNIISANNIEMSVDVAPLIQGGEASPLVVTLHNKNTVPLQSAKVTLLYKQGNGSQDEQEKIQEKRDIGVIKQDEFKKQDFTITMYGGESETRSVDLKLEYQIAGSNAIFTKIVSAEVVLKSPSVSVTIEGSEKVSVGQSSVYSFIVKNSSATSSLASVLQITFPNSFVTESSDPKPIARSTSWSIGTIPSGESKTVTVTGFFNGKQGEVGTFQAKVGSRGNDASSIGVVYSSKIADITLQASPLTLRMNLSNDGGSGEVLRYGGKALVTLSYDNGSSKALENVSFKLALSGDAAVYSSVIPASGYYDSVKRTVVWDKANFPELSVLAPNAHGVLQISIPIVQKGDNSPILKGIFSGQASVRDGDNVVSSLTKTWNVVGSATVEASTQYKNSSFQNSGPIPPHPNVETTYTAVFKVTAQSALSAAKVSFVLPSYVTWRGITSNAQGVTYNSKSRTVMWNVGSMEQGKITGVEVGLSVKPSLSHVGQTPAITSGIVLDADEEISKVHLRTTLSPLSIALRDEEWQENPSVVIGN